MDDDECSYLGGKAPLTIKASGGAHVTVNYTVKNYLVNWDGIRKRLVDHRPDSVDTLTAAACFMATL